MPGVGLSARLGKKPRTLQKSSGILSYRIRIFSTGLDSGTQANTSENCELGGALASSALSSTSAVTACFIGQWSE